MNYQLVSFETTKKNLGFFSINRQFSYNIKIQELQIATLQDFPIDTLKLINEVPQVEGE